MRNNNGIPRLEFASSNTSLIIGDDAGVNIGASATGNIFIGKFAGYANISGDQNTFIGTSAGSNNTASYNTFVGAGTGYFNTSGQGNVFIGEDAGANNSSASFNTFIGQKAGYSNTTGSSNTFLGNYAGYNNIGSDNTFIGEDAGQANTAGISNVFIGTNTGYSNLNGNGNTAIGVNALEDNTTGDFNVALGGGALASNTDGEYNTAVGIDAGNGFSVGNTYCSFLGRATITNNSTIRTNSTALGDGALITASNKVRIGNSSVTIIEGQVAWSYPSDGRFKFNVTEDVSGLAFIKMLRPVAYNFDTKKFDEFLMQDMPDSLRQAHTQNRDYSESTAIRHNGFIAQEVEQAAKKLNYNFDGIHKPADENDNYSISYSQFVVPMVKAIQEQQVLIEKLMEENKQLKERIEKVERK